MTYDDYIGLPSIGDGHWQAPVATSSALPATDNVAGDARAAQDTGAIYVWNGSAWVSSGGSGVSSVTASSPLASSGGSTPNITLSVPVPLPLGGSGFDNTLTTISTTSGQVVTDLTAPTNLIFLSGTSQVSIDGLVSNGTNRSVTILNFKNGNAIFNHQSTSCPTPADRFQLPNASTLIIPPQQGLTLVYDTVLSRWRVSGIIYAEAASGIPGIVSAGAQQFGGKKTFPDGCASSAFYYSLGFVGSVLFIDQSNGHFNQDNTHFFYDQDNFRLGLQTNFPLASGHFKSTVAITLPDPSPEMGTTELESVPTPQAPAVTIVDPDTAAVTAGSAAEDVTGTGYFQDGSLYEFQMFGYISNGMGGYSRFSILPYTGAAFTAGQPIDSIASATAGEMAGAGYTEAGSVYEFYAYPYTISNGIQYVTNTPYYMTFTDLNLGNTFDIEFIIATFSGVGAHDGVYITRQIDGGGYNDGIDIGVSLDFDDDNTLWTSSLDKTTLDALGTQIPFAINFSSMAVGAGLLAGPYDGIVIVRQIAGGGYNDGLDIGLSVPYVDNNTLWTAGLALTSITPLSNDFTATGTTYIYSPWIFASDPNGLSYFSNQTVTGSIGDPGTGYPYRVSIQNQDSVPVRMVNNTLSNARDFGGTEFFIQSPTNFTGSTVVTPSDHYGYPPDVTTQYYRVIGFKALGGGVTLYSVPTAFSTNTADPTNYWVSHINWVNVGGYDGFIIEYSTDGTAGGVTKYATVASVSDFYDDALITWTNGVPVITPTSAFSPSLISEGNSGFGGNTAPVYPVDTTGDINTTTGYRVGATPGQSVTLTFDATVSGSTTSMTFVGGILTASTTLP